jgi:hypothetical protein
MFFNPNPILSSLNVCFFQIVREIMLLSRALLVIARLLFLQVIDEIVEISPKVNRYVCFCDCLITQHV